MSEISLSEPSIEFKKSFKGIELSRNSKPIAVPIDQVEIKSAYDGTKGKFKSKTHSLVLQFSADAYNKLYDIEQECLAKMVKEKIDIKGYSLTEYMIMDNYKSNLIATPSSIKVKASCDQTKLHNVSSDWTQPELHSELKIGVYAQVIISPTLFWLMEKEDAPMMGISWILTQATILNEDVNLE